VIAGQQGEQMFSDLLPIRTFAGSAGILSLPVTFDRFKEDPLAEMNFFWTPARRIWN
jgi:hypothetical protein